MSPIHQSTFAASRFSTIAPAQQQSTRAGQIFRGGSGAPAHISPSPTPVPVYSPTSPMPFHLQSPVPFHQSPAPALRHSSPAPIFKSTTRPALQHRSTTLTPFLHSSLSPSYNGHAFPAHVPHKAPDSAQQAARSDKTSLFDNEVISLAELRRQRSLLFSTDNRQRSLPTLKDYRSSEEYRAVHVKS